MDGLIGDVADRADDRVDQDLTNEVAARRRLARAERERGESLVDRALRRISAVPITTWITFLVVAGSALLVASVLHPRLILNDSTPTGGDMGAHVWAPAYLRDHLLPHWKLVGWTPDWYAGFPAFQFYMILPSLAEIGRAHV